MTRKSPNIPTNSKDFSESQGFPLCNHGPEDASHGAMPRQITFQIGPIAPRPKVQGIPTRDDALYKAKREIEHLKHEVSKLENRIRRMVEDLEFEIAGWKAALDTGRRQESVEAIKRRISRLHGAILYQGVTNFDCEVKEK